MSSVFERDKNTKKLESELEKAYKKIGQLQVEIDFFISYIEKCISKRGRKQIVKEESFSSIKH